ncbi:MAG: hypothetical protein ACOYN0_19090 [Phycisphaerales bacterium]
MLYDQPTGPLLVERGGNLVPVLSGQLVRADAVGVLPAGRVVVSWVRFPNASSGCYNTYTGSLGPDGGLGGRTPVLGLWDSWGNGSRQLLVLGARVFGRSLASSGWDEWTPGGWIPIPWDTRSLPGLIHDRKLVSGTGLAWDGAQTVPFPAGATGQPWVSADGELYGKSGSNWCRLDGTSWTPIAPAPPSEIERCCWHAGTPVIWTSLRRFYRLVGGAWVELPAPRLPGQAGVFSLVSWNGDLYAGGADLATIAGRFSMAKWDGSAWVPVAGSPVGTVYELEGDGDRLWVTGNFFSAGGLVASGVAALQAACPSDVDCDGLTSIVDLYQFVDAWDSAAGGGDFDRNGVIDGDDMIAYFGNFDSGC